MKRILLDTNAILQNPEILSFRSPNIHLYIPQPILDELSVHIRKGASNYQGIIQKSLAAGIVHILASDQSSLTSDPPKWLPFARMSTADRLLLASALKMSREHKDDQIMIATKDRDVIEAARMFDIASIDPNSLIRTLISSGTSNPAINTDARKTLSVQRNQLIISFASGSFVTILLILLYLNLNYIVATINVWSTFALIPIFAVFLFWLRANHRQFYAWIEILVGCSASINVFWPSFDYGAIHTSSLLQLMAGLYAMVRGLDNLGKSLKGGRYYQTWNRFFPEE